MAPTRNASPEDLNRMKNIEGQAKAAKRLMSHRRVAKNREEEKRQQEDEQQNLEDLLKNL